MAKKTSFLCSQCGFQSVKWLGRCPDCGSWGSMEEQAYEPVEAASKPSKNKRKFLPHQSEAEPITKVVSENSPRSLIGLPEIDNVLGGGLVEGGFVLIGGEPGIGKSTLILQVASLLAKQGKKILYISGEESKTQIKLRAERLNCLHENIYLLSENSLETCFDKLLKLKPDMLIVDSIQTVYTDLLNSAPGTTSQIKECAIRFLDYAKKNLVPIFLIGHVTKEGIVAGPRVLEHIVDTVLYFEGEKDQQIRILRAVKNRFGTTNEIGLFEMTGMGLKEVENIELLRHLHDREIPPGCAFVPTVEGSRVMMIEIQALTNQNGGFGIPKRMASGIDHKRLSIILAVLEKYLGMQFASHDVYLNVVGGLKVVEPAVDLAIAFAIWSSFHNISVPGKVAFLGEVGLTGELRPASQSEKRLNELEKLGFETIYLADSHKKLAEKPKLQLYYKNNIRSLFKQLASKK